MLIWDLGSIMGPYISAKEDHKWQGKLMDINTTETFGSTCGPPSVPVGCTRTPTQDSIPV